MTGSTDTPAFIFFTIFDETTGTTVLNAGFLDPTTNRVLLPANTLAPGHLFDYTLDYSNRDDLSNTGGAQNPPELGFDVRTDGQFTTAAASAPEPSGAAMLLAAGFAGLLLLKRRRKITG